MALPKLLAGFKAGGIDMAKMAGEPVLEGILLGKTMPKLPGEGILVGSDFLRQAGILPSGSLDPENAGAWIHATADQGSKGLLRLASEHPGSNIFNPSSSRPNSAVFWGSLMGTMLGSAMMLIGVDALWQAMELSRLKGAETLASQSIVGVGSSPNMGAAGSARSSKPVLEMSGEVDVSATFQSHSDVPVRLRHVRTHGIQTRADVATALDYLVFMDKGLEPIVRLVRDRIKRKLLTIELAPSVAGSRAGTRAFANVTLNGFIDRSSPDFGESIVIIQNADPSVLLHEILHVLPLSEFRGLFGDQKLPETPCVDPNLSFTDLQVAILENGRVSEVISFGSQARLYGIEAGHGITHVYSNDMMFKVEGAWKREGFQGVRSLFSGPLHHYDKSLGRASILLALAVKVTGNTKLSFNEVRELVGSDPERQFEFVERYFNRYAEERGIDIPPNFFSFAEAVKRSGTRGQVGIVGGLNRLFDPSKSDTALVSTFQSMFDALDHFSRRTSTPSHSAPDARSKVIDVPPQASQPDRRRIFAAYTGIVDRLLEQPPASFTREELASLVSYTRLLPPEQSIEMADRLDVYLGAGYDDLKLTLGLILYDKGWKKEGMTRIHQCLTNINVLAQLLPTMLRILSPADMADVLTSVFSELDKKAEQVSDKFKAWAFGQFLIEGNRRLTANLQILFSHPEVLTKQGWHNFGLWLTEHPADIDYTVDDASLLLLTPTDESDYLRFIETRLKLVSILNLLRSRSDLPGEIRAVADAKWEDIVSSRSAAFATLGQILASAKNHAGNLIPSELLAELDVIPPDDLPRLLGKFPSPIVEAALVEAEFYTKDWWKNEDQILSRMTEMLAAGKELSIGAMRSFVEATHRKALSRGGIPNGEFAEQLAVFLRDLTIKIEGSRLLHVDEDSGDEVLTRFFDLGDLPTKYSPRAFYFSVLDGSRKIEWLVSCAELLPYNNEWFISEAERVLRSELGAIKSRALTAVRQDNSADVNVEVHFIENSSVPSAILLYQYALDVGDDALAERMGRFLKEEILLVVREVREAIEGSEKKFKPFADYYTENLRSLDWALRLEAERHKAIRANDFEPMLTRIRDELQRGGSTIKTELLQFFADDLIRRGIHAPLKELYRLMMRKSFLEVATMTGKKVNMRAELRFGGISQTISAIQRSPLQDNEKDELLSDYLDRLYSMAVSFRGVNLAMLSALQGLFAWRTPFMRAGDIPHYQKTEELLLKLIAQVPELVGTGRDKDDHVRLSVFAAAGLPLQRYADWTANIFAESDRPEALSSLLGRMSDRDRFNALKLPNPSSIPEKIDAGKVDNFLRTNGVVLQRVLSGADANDRSAIIRLLGRLLNAELNDMPGQSEQVFARSRIVKWSLSSIQNALKLSQRPAYVKPLIEMLLTAGPKNIYRLALARDLIERPQFSREERREIFTLATSSIVFSKRVRQRLIDLASSGDGDAELRYQSMLLSIRYERHSRGMPSNFFLDELERRPELLREYEKGVSESTFCDPLLIAEMGGSSSGSAVVRVYDAMNSDLFDRLSSYTDALRFLRLYVQVALNERVYDFADDYTISFSDALVWKHRTEFDGYQTSELKVGADLIYREETFLDLFTEILGQADWGRRLSNHLDRMPQNSRTRALIYDGEIVREIIGEIDRELEQAQRYKASASSAYLSDIAREAELPDFITSRQGLEHDLLVWAYIGLEPAQRSILRDKLAKAQGDRERLLEMGRAAHFEKLLQLASIHPAVPREFQDILAIFQEDVPHRDRIDVERTLAFELSHAQLSQLKIDLDHPIKEGTIGGIYSGTFQDDPVVIKIIPEGKFVDLQDALRTINAIRKGLRISNYATAGARTADDFLAFSARAIKEELSLEAELPKAAQLRELLAELTSGFTVPEYVEGIATPRIVVMKPILSRRLKELSSRERLEVFNRIDRDLIPVMLISGRVHFDLHPGNIGVQDDGTIVLYDMGRVHKLGEEEVGGLYDFYTAITMAKESGDVSMAVDALKKLGTVRDQEAFARIGELITGMFAIEDPLKAIEAAYPKLADYGFQLSDSYVKVLLMYLTWEGTKESF